MRKYRNRILLGLGIALAIYIGLLLIMDSRQDLSTEAVLAELAAYPWGLVIFMILAQIAAGFFRFLEWHYFLGVIDARDKISLGDSLVIFISGFTMVVSPGKIAEVLKAVLLKMKTGIPIAVSTPVVLAERIVDGLAVIVVMFIAVILAGNQLAVDPAISSMIILSALALAFGLVAIQIAPLAYFLLRVLARMPLLRRTHDWFYHFYESSRVIFSLRHLIPTTTMGVGVYMSSVICFMVVVSGFGVTWDWTTFLQIMFITGVASAVGALSFIPNGAGVTEVSNTVLLSAMLGMPPAQAAAAALIQGFFHKWFRVLVGLGVIFVFHNRLFPAEIEAELAELERLRNPVNQDELALDGVEPASS